MTKTLHAVIRRTGRIQVFLCATLLAVAQQSTEQAPGRSPLFRANTRVVIAHVTVTSPDGKFVSGLPQGEFRLLDNSRLQHVTQDAAVQPISMVVAVETSSVVEKILPKVRKIGSVLYTQVTGETGELALLGYNEKVEVITPFTSDPDQINGAFRKLKASGSAYRLNDAVMEAVRILRTRPADRQRVLLVIGQPRDNGSATTVGEILATREFSDIQVFSVNMSHMVAQLTATPPTPRPNPVPPEARRLPVGTGTPTTDAQVNLGDWTPLFKDLLVDTPKNAVKDPMTAYVRFSGGREYSFVSTSALERALADIGEELHCQYVLTYQVEAEAKAGFHQIAVLVANPDLRVRTRRGFWLEAQSEGFTPPKN